MGFMEREGNRQSVVGSLIATATVESETTTKTKMSKSPGVKKGSSMRRDKKEETKALIQRAYYLEKDTIRALKMQAIEDACHDYEVVEKALKQYLRL